MSWRDSDNYFVGSSLTVYWVDLSKESLQYEKPKEDIKYDGPDGPDREAFRRFLRVNGLFVNHKGKAIVRVRKDNNFKPEKDDKLFLLERKVPLETYGFTKEPPLPPTAEVEELKCVMEEIRESMKKVFVDVADQLKAPANGDPKSVLGFLKKLRDLIVGKEFGATFLGDANKVLASIATIFNQRNGLSIDGMVTTSTRAPEDLIQDLNSLKTFVENRFFIDGTVVVKSYGLMKEKDIPFIFRNIEAGEAELSLSNKGTISIDNMDGGNGKSSDSIFYGYFNVPWVGKFKGILTRDDFTLPNEITVKLGHRPYNLAADRFWYVKSNGEAIFEKSFTRDPGLIGWNLDDYNYNKLGFLRSIVNKTFVNRVGKYIKFALTLILLSGPPKVKDDSIHFYNDIGELTEPFTMAQYDRRNKAPKDPYIQRRVSISVEIADDNDKVDFNDVLLRSLGRGHAFVYEDTCFIGNITEFSPPPGADFRNNAAVTAFFEVFHSGQGAYVDALGTTFFDCNKEARLYRNKHSHSPKLLLP